MKLCSYCAKCGEAAPIFENGLCKDCFTKELHEARTSDKQPVRPNKINIGLKICSVCRTRAASLRGMCSICYKRAQYAALTPEQRATKSATAKRRRDAKRATETVK